MHSNPCHLAFHPVVCIAPVRAMLFGVLSMFKNIMVIWPLFLGIDTTYEGFIDVWRVRKLR